MGTANMTFSWLLFQQSICFVPELCVKLRVVKEELPEVAKF